MTITRVRRLRPAVDRFARRLHYMSEDGLVARAFAVSLGAIALGIQAIRIAITGSPIPSSLAQSLIGMVVFVGIGYVIGAIADYVVRYTVENRFRLHVAEIREQFEQQAEDGLSHASGDS